jgi:hypothetical protein
MGKGLGLAQAPISGARSNTSSDSTQVEIREEAGLSGSGGSNPGLGARGLEPFGDF